MDQGNHVIANNVLGFSLSYDSQNKLFLFDFDIGLKSRIILIPASLLSEIGALSKDWKNLGQHTPVRLNTESEQAPTLIKLKAKAATDGSAVLYLHTQSGKVAGLIFSPIVWREFVTSLRT